MNKRLFIAKSALVLDLLAPRKYEFLIQCMKSIALSATLERNCLRVE